jgi:hypothetical protein
MKRCLSALIIILVGCFRFLGAENQKEKPSETFKILTIGIVLCATT